MLTQAEYQAEKFRREQAVIRTKVWRKRNPAKVEAYALTQKIAREKMKLEMAEFELQQKRTPEDDPSFNQIM